MLVRRPKAAKKPKHRPARKAPHVKRTSKAARRKRKRYRATTPGTCTIKDGVIVWTLPRKLQSLNKLRGWRSRHGDTKAWEREVEAAKILENDLSIGQFSGRRLRLEIIRLAPNDRWFLDTVNLYGGCKGLEDVLVRQKFLVDDCRRWVDMSASQGVSSDGKYWTIVRLSESKPEEPALVITPGIST